MGIIDRLFGSNKKRSLQDRDFGDFVELRPIEDEIIWQGQVKIFNETISLYMSGPSMGLDLAQKAKLLEVLKNEAVVEEEVNKALKEQYEEAGKHYFDWRAHFKCITMSTMGGEEISITFEEKDSLHQFNVFFLDCKANGVSIDS